MKPYRLRPRAREDRRAELVFYRHEAGAKVAAKLVEAMSKALAELELNPVIGLRIPALFAARQNVRLSFKGVIGPRHPGRATHCPILD